MGGYRGGTGRAKDTDVQGDEGRNGQVAQDLPDLQLCNTYRHLLMSLATIAHAGHPATVLYLEDALPIPADMRLRLAQACPLATFVFTRDADQMAAFARLPRGMPAIIRRNLTIGAGGLTTARNWQMPLLAGQRFATGYLYHAGFFTAKAVAARCRRVVLRESGLNNYVRLKVPPLKAVLRALAGLPPRHQVWGEERWIDAIEVSHPADLPAEVRGKARAVTFSDVMDVLPPATARNIAAAFCAQMPQIASAGTKTAILLTQPIDDIGICSVIEKQALYGQIVGVLADAGYIVSVKPHPSEAAFTLPGVVTLPPAFPVEAWPYITDQKFTLAVALCSAALVSGARAFADQTTQLLTPAVFNADHFADWPGLIAPALVKALQR
jgi:Alpha-2,8-polysialyltransferase (POLYST)